MNRDALRAALAATAVLSGMLLAAPGCGSATPRSESPSSAAAGSEEATHEQQLVDEPSVDGAIEGEAPVPDLAIIEAGEEPDSPVASVEDSSPEPAPERSATNPQQDAVPTPLVQRGRLAPESLPRSTRRERTQPGTALAARTQIFYPPFGERDLLADSQATWRSRRAYDGAPPVLPHSAEFGKGSKACLDCHEQGMTLGARVAHPMSHTPLAACLQCHVEGKSATFPEAAERLPTPNTFRGTRDEARGERAFEGAPPLIPHTLRMRANCLACHGEFGWPGLRIDHSQRGNCVQCHLAERESLPGE